MINNSLITLTLVAIELSSALVDGIIGRPVELDAKKY